MNAFWYSLIFIVALRSAEAIRCYVCNTSDSSSPFQCGEWFERFDRPNIDTQNCSSVHDAQYCIKHIGRFEVSSIMCYQCSASETMSCSDLVINMPDSPLKPASCDHVHDAKYCIKSTALNGGIGAKRYCSSKDLGNYCHYVKHIGDQQEYRSCIFTCSTDGCNSSNVANLSKFLFITSIVLLVYNKILS